MKWVAAVLVFLAAPLFAETRYIVEFRGAQRLGDDVAALRDDAPRVRVRRHFSRLLDGAAIELADGASIDEIARLH